jgi:hypothetical protein
MSYCLPDALDPLILKFFVSLAIRPTFVSPITEYISPEVQIHAIGYPGTTIMGAFLGISALLS